MAADGQMLLRRVHSSFSSTERTNAENTWTLLAEFLFPNQSGIFLTNNESPGSKRTARLFDSVPVIANHDLATTYHATLTNPATKWSKIRFKNDELNNDPESVMWMEKVVDIIHDQLNESNFDRQISKGYKLFTALATMPLLHEVKKVDGVFDGFKFTALHLSEVSIEENADGEVDTLYRKFKLTAKQALQKWGKSNLSDKIVEAAVEKPNQKFCFIHCIYPRNPKEVQLNSQGLAPGKKRPFASVYIEQENGNVIKEDGFYEFPAYVPRWDTMPGEVYGRGPGHNALPDIRTLNRLKDLMLHSLAKAAAPPIFTTMRNVMGTLDLRPNGVNVLRDVDGLREFVPQARFDVAQLNVQELQNSIRQAFFIDKLQLPPREQTGEMTAFEIQRRLEQMQRVLGPTISRFASEFLSPLIVRTFKILLREGVLPPAPALVDELGLDVEIVFINQLSRAQQMDSLNNIQQWVNDLAGLAQLKPEVLDHINVDGIAKHTAKVRGVPEIAVTNNNEIQQTREQRAEQQAAAQALEAGVKAADIAAKSNQGGGQGGSEPI